VGQAGWDAETFNLFDLAIGARSFTIAQVSPVTHILEAIQQGNPKAAEELLPLVYDELRKLAAHKMASERPGQTLQPTALVHEAWLRLVGTGHSSSRTARIALPQQPRPCGASWWGPLEGRSA